MAQQEEEKEKVINQIAHYDELMASYVDLIERINKPAASDETKILINLANESLQHCQDKRAILVSHLNTLNA
ncbi:hypothetical protein [Spirosoma linguale]|uniref:Uncharacterized protein n=1 Tax=Spirosoma linguale (strain ATCC 33905 / DSM 74 / LMG 10896 / Claus 1) TaxID=504472 RepID=D2QTU2_SPILD|nr:hypothetical protein Slin_6265 [Spirosoma linguale DSM 74]